MRAVIFSGGEVRDYQFTKSVISEADIIIAADSGLEHLKKIDIEPDIFIGDMDSISVKPFGREIIKLEVMKDETDTEAAARIAIEKGADEIVFIGATGTRLDHSLANILLLKQLSQNGIDAIITDEKNEIRYFNNTFDVKGTNGDILSIIPLENLEVVSTTGLLYKLNNETLEVGSSRGVSNVMTDTAANVQVKSGSVLVIKSKD